MTIKLYRKGLKAILLLLLAQPVQAQEAKHITLEEAINLSLQNNKKLKLSQARVEEASASLLEMKDNRLPDFKVSGSYLRLSAPDVTLKVKLGSGNNGEQTQGNSVNVKEATYGIANITMPVFSGFRLKHAIESTLYLEKAAKMDAENDKEEIIQNTISAYGNLYKAKQTIDLINQNLKQQQQRVSDFTNLEKNGLMARNDLLKAQLQQSNIELAVMDAENNYRIASINMALMTGLPNHTMLQPDSSVVAVGGDAGNLEQWEKNAFENRKDMSALYYRQQAVDESIKSTKGEYYPGVAITGGYVAAYVPNLLTITNALNVGIGLQYNFAALWKTGAKLDVAKAKMHQLQASQDILHDQVTLQVSQAFENYLLANRKIQVYATAIDQASENYRITKNKFDNNLVTTTDLLEADLAQLQARLNHAFARVDAAIAYKKLQQTTGMLNAGK